MKTFLKWRESFSASGVARDAKHDQGEYGNMAASGLQGVVDALRLLAQKDPQSYNFIISKIRTAAQRVDPSMATAIGTGGRRYGVAVQKNSQENGGEQ